MQSATEETSIQQTSPSFGHGLVEDQCQSVAADPSYEDLLRVAAQRESFHHILSCGTWLLKHELQSLALAAAQEEDVYPSAVERMPFAKLPSVGTWLIKHDLQSVPAVAAEVELCPTAVTRTSFVESPSVETWLANAVVEHDLSNWAGEAAEVERCHVGVTRTSFDKLPSVGTWLVKQRLRSLGTVAVEMEVCPNGTRRMSRTKLLSVGSWMVKQERSASAMPSQLAARAFSGSVDFTGWRSFSFRPGGCFQGLSLRFRSPRASAFTDLVSVASQPTAPRASAIMDSVSVSSKPIAIQEMPPLEAGLQDQPSPTSEALLAGMQQWQESVTAVERLPFPKLPSVGTWLLRRPRHTAATDTATDHEHNFEEFSECHQA